MGPQKVSAEGARIEAPNAPRGVAIGEGCFSLSNRLSGLGEHREVPQRGGAPTANAFLAYLRPTGHFYQGRENSVTLLNTNSQHSQFFSVKIHSIDNWGEHGPLAPSLATPVC